MSYWSELLIETYHFLIKQADEIERSVKGYGAGVYPKRLRDQAAAIKKRMRSLGYHTCWKDEEEVKMELP